MNYSIKKEGEKKFLIIENQTQTKINAYRTLKDAKKRRMELESGMGFNGWTPTFILNK